MTVDRVGGLDTPTGVVGFLMCRYESPSTLKRSDIQYAQWQLVPELSGTNVQLFHLRVEGGAFHSQSSGCTRCAPYHSARLFQRLKDELALDLSRHLARRRLRVTSQMFPGQPQFRRASIASGGIVVIDFFSSLAYRDTK